MKRAEVYVNVRPFLEQEVGSCNILRIPVKSAVLVGTAEGDCDDWFRRGVGKPPGVGVAVVRDVREDSVRGEREVTNCFWGVEGVEGGPPITHVGTVAREIASPALTEFLSGRDVAVAAFGARGAGKSTLLFGDASQGESVLSAFTESLWEAFGGEEHHEHPNQITVSAVEISHTGRIFDLIGKAECPEGTEVGETFSGPVPGMNPLWDIFTTAQQGLHGNFQRNQVRGTFVLSLRVEKRGVATTNYSSCPVISFLEVDPAVCSNNSNTLSDSVTVSEAIRQYLTVLESGGGGGGISSYTKYPPGVGYILQCLQGRSWCSKIIGCVSPSPTALQASLQTVNLVGRFYVEAVPSSGVCSMASTPASLPVEPPHAGVTPRREVTGVLAFTPEDGTNPMPRPGPPTPTPARTTPLLVNNSGGGSVVEDNNNNNICGELIGLVKMLKGEVETLRGELADERRRYQDGVGKEEALRREKEEMALKLEVVEGENRNILRELREREEESATLGFSRSSTSRRRPKVYTTSSASVYVRQNSTKVITPTPGGVGLSPRKARSRTPPTVSHKPSTTRSSSSHASTPVYTRRTSLGAQRRIPSLVSDSTLTSSASSSSPRPMGYKVQRAPKQRGMPTLTRQSRNITAI